MKRLISIFILLFFLLIGAFIMKKNSYLFSKKLLTSTGESLIWNAALFDVSEQNQDIDSSVFFYRNDPQRNARFKLNKMPTSFVEKWTSEEINVGIHTASKASPVSDGKYIFAGGDTGEFYCFDSSGDVRWRFFFGEATYGIHSTAAIDNKHVYIGSYRGTIYKINKETGKLVWMRIVGQTIGASPFLDGENLVVAVETLSRDGYVLKMNKNTGEILWRSMFLGEQSHSSPALSHDKRVLVLGANNKKVFGIDYGTGGKLWDHFLDGEIKSTPLIVEQEVYLTTWGGSLYKLDVSTGKVLWRSSLGSASQVSPAYLEKKKLIVSSGKDGELIAFSRISGSSVWRLKERPGRQLSSPVILTDGIKESILFYCEERKMCLIDDNGKIVKKFNVEGRVTSSPFLIAETLYLTLNEKGLQAFSITQ